MKHLLGIPYIPVEPRKPNEFEMDCVDSIEPDEDNDNYSYSIWNLLKQVRKLAKRNNVRMKDVSISADDYGIGLFVYKPVRVQDYDEKLAEYEEQMKMYKKFKEFMKCN